MLPRSITDVIADTIGLDEDEVLLSQRLVQDLSLDSIDHIELVMALEEEYEIEIDEGDALKWHTVQDVVDHVTPLRNRK